MKKISTILVLMILMACNGSAQKKGTTAKDAAYFEYTVEGKTINVAAGDISTSYNVFGAKTEFKIFAGSSDGPAIVLTIPNKMSAPSVTPSGSPDPVSSISQGSFSITDYPEKGYTFNSYDYLVHPKPVPQPDAIKVTDSRKTPDGKGQVISGTFNVTTVLSGKDHTNPSVKPYRITGKFSVVHLFNGQPF